MRKEISRLMNREELCMVDDICRKEGIEPTSIKRLWKQLEAQDGKTASIKEAKFEKKCKECEYDPQAAEFGWFLEHGWIPPEEAKKKEAEWWDLLDSAILAKDAECQERVEGILKDLREAYPAIDTWGCWHIILKREGVA